jgi:hypothetical protein
MFSFLNERKMKMNVKRERSKEAKTKRNVVESFEAEKEVERT